MQTAPSSAAEAHATAPLAVPKVAQHWSRSPFLPMSMGVCVCVCALDCTPARELISFLFLPQSLTLGNVPAYFFFLVFFLKKKGLSLGWF